MGLGAILAMLHRSSELKHNYIIVINMKGSMGLVCHLRTSLFINLLPLFLGGFP